MTTAQCIAWFEEQCESNRRNLRIIVLVPNSDGCVYFVQELLLRGGGSLRDWKDIGDGFTITGAINDAAQPTDTTA